MSEASLTHSHSAAGGSEDISDIVDRFRLPAILLGLIGLLVLVAAGLKFPVPALRAYLFAFMFFVGVPLGCMAFIMLQHMTGGLWGLAMRRIAEAATRLLYVMPIFFIPIALGVKKLYPWADPDMHYEFEAATGQFKQWWLRPSFFILRSAIYFAVWIVMALLLNKWSADEDKNIDARATRKLQLISGPGLLLFVTLTTFAIFDWVMSLDPDWFSTIFGLLFIVGQGLSALALCVIVLSLVKDRRPFVGVIGNQQFHDIGNLMLAFTMLWAYMSFSQLLIIWSGNIDEETPYYYQRLITGWRWVGLFLVIFHFAVPFFLLLNRPMKRNINALVRIALLIVFMRFVDLKWHMGPAFAKAIIHHNLSATDLGGYAFNWMDPFAVIGIGGVWIWLFIAQLKRRPLIPPYDYRLLELEVDHHHG